MSARSSSTWREETDSMPSLDLLLQLIGVGLVFGAGYAVVSLGLTLVFGIMRVINFAHGEFYMLGAFAVYYLSTAYGIHYLLAVVIATLLVGAFAYLLSVVLVARLTRQHETAMLIATLGLSYMLTEGTQIVVSGEPRNVPTPYQDEIVMLGQTFFTQQQILTVIVAVVATAMLFYYIRFTRGGRLMQAVAQNRTGAALVGININMIYHLTFAIGCGLAALGGATLGATTAIYPSIGQVLVIKVFVVLILGGMGSVPGALFGGVLLGLIESLGGGLISVEYTNVFGYLVLVLMLLFRPQGLFGKGHAA